MHAPLAALLMSCTGSTPVAAPPETPVAAPPETPVVSPTPEVAEAPSVQEAPAATGSVLEQLLAAGACANADATPGSERTVKQHATSDGRPLYEVSCAFFAYQGSYDYLLGPPQSAKRLGVDVLGLPEWKADSDRLHWFEKARGPGDCGTYHEYQLTGDNLTVDVVRERSCTDAVGENDDIPSASTWNITGPPESLTGVLSDLQNGDAACYVLYTDGKGRERNWYGDFDLCGLDALKGKPVVVELGRGQVIAPSCEGDPECADSVQVDLAVGIVAAAK